MDQARAELAALAHEEATFPARRADAAHRAHAAGLTWTEISDILGMSRLGLRKALAKEQP